MNKFRFTIKLMAIAIFLVAFATMTQAQATRTWVSGVGDDANPCSRTAPCKTFAGAISKTATDGEINCIDSGGFGAVTITKSITIDGTGVQAGILAAGTTGVIVNVSTLGTTNSVQLRNLSINGAGTGTNGVRIIGGTGTTVEIESCVIFGFRTGNGRGITDERTLGGKLYVLNTIVKNNSGFGAVTLPSSGSVLLSAVFDTCQFINNQIGLVADTGSVVTAINCTSVHNSGAGFFAEGTGVGSTLNLQKCLASQNGQGVTANTLGTVKISDVQITNNSAGLNITGGTVQSYGNNNITGNGSANGPPNGTAITQQ